MATKSNEVLKSSRVEVLRSFLFLARDNLYRFIYQMIQMKNLIKGVVYIAFVLLAYLAGSVWLDLKYGKIRNYYIVFGVLLAILLRGLAFQLTSCISIIFGSFILFILLYPFFKIGTIGAGDIKLLMVCFWFFNVKTGLWITVIAFVIGGILSLIKMIYYHELLDRMQYLWSYICDVVGTKSIRLYENHCLTQKEENSGIQTHQIHFSIAIALSAFVCLIIL